MATIIKIEITKFVWANIVCRFGIPHSIITDNGKSFVNVKFNKLFFKLGIKHFNLSPAHPEANDQVEAINKIIKYGLRLRIEDHKDRWVEEFP